MIMILTMKTSLYIFLLFISLTSVYSQSDLLQSGPMVGYTKPGATQLWVQTKKEAVVKIKYYEITSSEKYYFTSEYSTLESEAYTAHLIADKTEPGKKYQYELYINDILVPRPYPLSFKMSSVEDEPGDFKVAMGSCVYVNDSLYDKGPNFKGGSYDIYDAICKQQPEMMLWLGDNVYYRKKEWESKDKMLYRNTHTRSLSQIQPLIGSTENYAIWDDHDYGPNNSDREFENKKVSLDVFKLFWANPSYGFGNKKSATTTFIKEDVQFFLMDDRTFRSPKDTDSDDKRCILGDDQLDWLIKELKASTSTFKIIALGVQVLNPLKLEDIYSSYKEERDKFLKALEKEKISGIVFLSGDRHFSEGMEMGRGTLYPLYEFTVSPLNSSPYIELKEENPIRIKESLVKQHNFATIDFFGEKKDRAMRFAYYDKAGILLFEKVIKAETLK